MPCPSTHVPSSGFPVEFGIELCRVYTRQAMTHYTVAYETSYYNCRCRRDVASGRRTEIDFTNGLVAVKGEEVGVPAPTHAVVTALVRRIDRGELEPDPANIAGIAV